eukprot:scaffold309726_cov30-Tisochrysis_lutea.AAC.1
MSAGLSDGGHGTPHASKCSGILETGPKYMVSPALISSSWWKRANVSARGWWMVQASVRPRSAKRRSELTTCWAPYASRPDVGSSRSTSAGFEMSSIAIVTRRRWPPERPPETSSPMRVSATWPLLAADGRAEPESRSEPQRLAHGERLVAAVLLHNVGADGAEGTVARPAVEPHVTLNDADILRVGEHVKQRRLAAARRPLIPRSGGRWQHSRDALEDVEVSLLAWELDSVVDALEGEERALNSRLRLLGGGAARGALLMPSESDPTLEPPDAPEGQDEGDPQGDGQQDKDGEEEGDRDERERVEPVHVLERLRHGRAALLSGDASL